MKKSLIVSISALLFSVMALGACTPNVPESSDQPGGSDTTVPSTSEQEIFTIDQLLNGEISDETGYWEPTYNGRHVRIEKAGVVLAYEHEMYIQQTTGETVGDLHSIQVLNDTVDFTEYFYNNLVNVEGEVALVEDRVVITNATVELVSDGTEEDENYVYFWPNMDRLALDNGTKYYAGTMVSSVLQVASKPQPIVAGQEMTFKVTFPGEDLDLNNEENIFLMDFTIPACLEAEEIEEANALFGSLEVGDGVSVLACLHFIKGYFSYLYMPGVGTNDIYNYATPLENIFSNAQEVHDEFVALHTTTADEFPLFEAKDANGKNLIYSYVGNDDRFSKTNGIFTITAYTYSAKEVYDALVDVLTKAEWTLFLDQTEEADAIEFISKGQTDRDLANNVIDIMKNEGSVTIAIITKTIYEAPKETTHATFEELTAQLKANVQRYAKEKDFLLSQGARNYTTQIVDVKNVLAAEELVNTYFLSKKKESMNVVNNIEAAHELIRFELNVTDEARLTAIKDAYFAALEEAGWIKLTIPSTIKKAPKGEGYYNKVSGEFIAIKDIKTKVVAAVEATDTAEAKAEHGVFEFYLDVLSLEVNRDIRRSLPKEPETNPEA